MSSAKKQTIMDGFLWYCFRLFVTANKQFFRFSMTKKLCAPLAHWYVTKWPAITNRFVTPVLDKWAAEINTSRRRNKYVISALFDFLTKTKLASKNPSHKLLKSLWK